MNDKEECNNCYFFRSPESHETRTFSDLIKHPEKLKEKVSYCIGYRMLMEFSDEKRWFFDWKPKSDFNKSEKQGRLFEIDFEGHLVEGSDESLWHFQKKGFQCKRKISLEQGTEELLTLFAIPVLKLFCDECYKYYYYSKTAWKSFNRKCPNGHEYNTKIAVYIGNREKIEKEMDFEIE